jgi:hypothetical protein
VGEGTDANKPIFWHYSEIATSRPLKIQRHNPPHGARRKDG